MRTLKLQKENCTDDALSLFKELLETQILFEVSIRRLDGSEGIFLTPIHYCLRFDTGNEVTPFQNIDIGEVQLL